MQTRKNEVTVKEIESYVQTNATNSNKTQQHATGCANGRNMQHPTMLEVIGQKCCVCLRGAKCCKYALRLFLACHLIFFLSLPSYKLIL